WNGEEKLLFDPGTYKTGAVMTIEAIVPAWDGKHVAMGISSGGAEYSEIRILDVDRKVLLPERMYPSLAPIGWTRSNDAFFYDAGKVLDIKSQEIELNRKTRLHKLATDVAS